VALTRGTRLGPYEIAAQIGSGGTVEVYAARDTRLDRAVAIKVLPSDRISDPDRKRRFVQEAKAASALNHPAIVTIYDIGSEAGVDFIVMEYARGRTLDQVIPPRIGLRPVPAMRYGAEIADALAKAHGSVDFGLSMSPDGGTILLSGWTRLSTN
jgi:eukaryotic-like serine/threonine-protein kinase